MTTDVAAELRARQQITDLIYDYCRLLDAMDLISLAELFTDECVVDYGPGPGFQSAGAAQLRQDLARMWRWTRTSHHSSNVQITFTSSETARATSYVLAWHERPDGTAATMMGQYHDELVRQSAVWRIARRRQLLTGNDQGFNVDINRFERMPDLRAR